MKKFKITTIENQGADRPMIEGLFTGKSKSGKEFKVSPFLSEYGVRFYIENQEGYSREASNRYAMFKNGKPVRDSKEFKEDGEFFVYCHNEYINESMFGVKANAWLHVPDFSLSTYREAEKALKEYEKNRIANEIAGIKDSDTVTLVKTITGYGLGFHLKHESLSWDSMNTFESDIKMIQKSEAVNWKADDPWEASQYFAEMTFGEFKALVAETRAETEKKKSEQEVKDKADHKDVEENELMIFAADTIYSSAGSRMLHSIGAVFGEKIIEVYSTRYTWEMKKSGIDYTDTYHAREDLKDLGFQWNADSKKWVYHGDITEEFGAKVIEVMKKYDTKVWPADIGFSQCWECGTYFRPGRGDWDDGMPYCGC